ncbi:MAG: hypothetical protein JXR91_02320, partial [Deltaproteobacteria bacterium]|nr:hypothetical protein [Deltaproteobacteria bacterium]
MKKFLLLSIAALLIVTGCQSEDSDLKVTESIVSRVELVSGRVWSLEKDGKTEIITGDMLQDNSHIMVGEGSRALVKMSNGSEIFINE